MRKLTSAEIKRGQAITFRIPSDTPDYALKQLQRLKETEGRNFSSKVAQFVLSGVGNSPHQDKEFVTLPLPQRGRVPESSNEPEFRLYGLPFPRRSRREPDGSWK